MDACAKYYPFWAWVYDWQTLVSGLLAVVAAAVSVYFLNKQIRQAEQHEKERLARRLVAERGVMPATLSFSHISNSAAVC